MNTEIHALRQQLQEKDRLLSAYNQFEHRITNSLQEKDSQNFALTNQLHQEVEAKDAITSKLNEELRDKEILARKLSGEENLIASLSSSLSASEQSNRLLVERITQGEHLLEAEKKMGASFKSRVDMEEQKHIALKSRLEEKDRELVVLKHTLHEVEGGNATLSAELSEQKTRYFELENISSKERQEKASLCNRISEVEAENVQLLNQLHDTESDIRDLKHEVNKLITEKDDLSLKLRAAESGNLILMENLATIEDEELALKHEEKSATAAMTNRLLLAEAKVNHLTKRVLEEENKIVLFAQKKADQEILLLNKITNQEGDIRVLSTNVATLTTEKNAISNNLEQYHLKLRDAESQQDLLRSRLRDEEKEKKLLLGTIREFESKFTALQHSMEQKVLDHNHLEQQCHTLRSQLSELSVSNMDKIGSAFSVVADLRLMLSQKDSQLSSLSADVRSLQAEKAHMERQLSDATAERDVNSKNLEEVQRILELVEKENHSLREIKSFLEASLRSDSVARTEKTQAIDMISVQLADMKISCQELKGNLQLKERELSEAQQKLREMVKLLTTNIDEMKALNDEKHFLMVDLEKTQNQATEFARLLSVANAEIVSLRDSHSLQENGRVHEVTQLTSPVSSNYSPPSSAQVDRVEQIVIATKGNWTEETKAVQEEMEKRNTNEVSINDRYIDASPVRSVIELLFYNKNKRK